MSVAMLLNAATVVTAAERRKHMETETGRIPIQSLLSSDADKTLAGSSRRRYDDFHNNAELSASSSVLGKRKLANTTARTDEESFKEAPAGLADSGASTNLRLHRRDSSETDMHGSDWGSGLSDEDYAGNDGDVTMSERSTLNFGRPSPSKVRIRRAPCRRKERVIQLERSEPQDRGVSLGSRCSADGESRRGKGGKTKNESRAARRLGTTRNAPRRRWKEHEDALLLQVVEEHGPGRWNSLAERFPGRNGRQVRLRWMNHLQPSLDKREWREEEDVILLESHRMLGNKWALIAMRLNGRTDNSVKNRYKSLMRRAQREAKGKQQQ